MAQKFLDGFGKTPRVVTELTEFQKRQLRSDKWFVEYTNTDTRNAIAQGLELVDHDGDTIFYDGRTLHGFKIDFDKIMFMMDSKSNMVYEFVVYHKKPTDQNWAKWRLNMKAPQEILNKHVRSGHVVRPKGA